jgi:hypothetical protein
VDAEEKGFVRWVMDRPSNTESKQYVENRNASDILVLNK